MNYRTEHPFMNLIDIIEDVKFNSLHLKEQRTQDTLLHITGFLRAANHAEFDTTEAMSVKAIRDAFNNEQLPYLILHDNVDFLMIGCQTKPCPTRFHSIDMIQRYLRGMEAIGIIPEINIAKNLKALSSLYNYAFGPFYVDDYTHTYSVDDINMLFQYCKIPYRITVQSYTIFRGMTVPSYAVKECRWPDV